MELEELKNKWQEVSQEISKQPIINRRLLDEVVVRKTHGFIRLNYWAIVVLAPLMLFYVWLYRESWYSMCFFSSVVVVGIPWALYIMRHLRRAEDCSLSVIEREKQLLRFMYLNKIYNFTWIWLLLVWIAAFMVDHWYGQSSLLTIAIMVVLCAVLAWVGVRWENSRIHGIGEALKRVKEFEQQQD